MTSSRRVMVAFLGLVALCLWVCLGTTGQEEQKKIPMEGFGCDRVTLKLHVLLGVDKPLIYICDSVEVDLDPNGHNFKMSFKKDQCPFVEKCDDIGKTVVDTASPVIKHMKQFDKLTLIKYTVWVDGHKPIDPIIIGGGGHGWGYPSDPAFQKSK
jgi:hypothetical protein